MTNPGLASRMEMPPEMDWFNDLSGDLANDTPNTDASMPKGWECPRGGNATQTGTLKCLSGAR
jgi:hypothetical protein